MKKNEFLKRIMKFTAMALTAGAACFGSFGTKVKAAPEVMPDGTIFDAAYYAAANPDVVSVCGTDKTTLYSHYRLYGANEGRLPYLGSNETFDPLYYASKYPDVAAVYGLDSVALYRHYIMTGVYEGKLPNAAAKPLVVPATPVAPAIAAAPSATAVAATPQAAQTLSTDPTQLTTADAGFISAVHSYINSARTDYGTLSKPVELSPALTEVAKVRLSEIQEEFSHIRANHLNYGSAIRDAGIKYTYEGECISHANTLRDTITYWHSTPEEWKMLIDGNFKKVGIAAGDGYTVAIFIG